MSKNLKLKSLGYFNYSDYLASKHWDSIKILFKNSRHATFKNGLKSCFSCSTTDKIHIHHKTYERLGHEKLSDLVYLCENCHSIAHTLVNKGSIELENAHLYIENFKKGLLKKGNKTLAKSKKQKVKVFKLSIKDGKIKYKNQKEENLIKKAIQANQCSITIRVNANFKPS